MNDMGITGPELDERLRGSEELVLLDIRQPEERAIVQLPNSQLIDGELVQVILDTWPKDTPIVCYCHHGIRSLEAAMYFKSNGFTNVLSLTGGIDAWSVEIDPSLPRY